MQLVNKKILLISPESWGQNFVSKHHYAKELANRGNAVFFLNRPSTSFQFDNIEQGLTIVDYKPRFRGLGKLPNKVSAYLIKKEIETLQTLLGLTFDVIWNFDSSRFFNLASVTDKLKICHIVDLSEDFQRDLLAKTSDVCFCTSDFIAEELKLSNDKVYKIHHGYKIPDKKNEIEEKFDSTKVQVGYVGNLSRSCIDWELIFEVISKFPMVQFNFIGSVTISNLSGQGLEAERLLFLKEKKNVTLLGEKESSLIPSYLDCFDVLLCAYKLNSQEDIRQHSNLHKLMEYIGSGKVTVSTYVDEYKDKRDLLEMVEERDEFVIKFRQVVESLNLFNNSDKQDLRKKFVRSNQYSTNTDLIQSYL